MDKTNLIEAASFIDRIFNGDVTGDNRPFGFVVIAVEMNSDNTHSQYLASIPRLQAIKLLKTQITILEGLPLEEEVIPPPEHKPPRKLQ